MSTQRQPLKFSDLPLLQTVSANRSESIPAVSAGNNLRVTIAQIAGAVRAADIGLANVNNTSDADKPVSNLMQQALNQKAALSHSHTPGDITGLAALLDAKADADHTHEIGQIQGLTAELQGKAPLSHTHVFADVTGLQEEFNRINDILNDIGAVDLQQLQEQIAGKADRVHRHETSDIDGLDDQLHALTVSNQQLTTALAGKSNVGHTHATSDITGLPEFIQTTNQNYDALVLQVAGKANVNHTHLVEDILDYEVVTNQLVLAAFENLPPPQVGFGGAQW